MAKFEKTVLPDGTEVVTLVKEEKRSPEPKPEPKQEPKKEAEKPSEK